MRRALYAYAYIMRPRGHRQQLPKAVFVLQVTAKVFFVLRRIDQWKLETTSSVVSDEFRFLPYSHRRREGPEDRFVVIYYYI